jgi:hypothetical protein
MRRMVLIAVVVASALFAAQTAPTATTGDTDVLGTTATVDPGSLTCNVPESYVVSCKTTGSSPRSSARSWDRRAQTTPC